MMLVLASGERHEAPVFPQLMKGGAAKREGPGRYEGTHPGCSPEVPLD